jgi:hypothetical protein
MGGPNLTLGMWLSEPELDRRLATYADLLRWAIMHPWGSGAWGALKVHRRGVPNWVPTGIREVDLDNLQSLVQKFSGNKFVIDVNTAFEFWRWKPKQEIEAQLDRHMPVPPGASLPLSHGMDWSRSIAEFRPAFSPTQFQTSGAATTIQADVYGHFSVTFDEVTEFVPDGINASHSVSRILFGLPRFESSPTTEGYYKLNRSRMTTLCKEMIMLARPQDARLGWEGDVYFPLNGVLVYHRSVDGYRADLARILSMYAANSAPWQQRHGRHCPPIREFEVGSSDAFGLRTRTDDTSWEKQVRQNLDLVVELLGTPQAEEFSLSDEDIMEVVTSSRFDSFQVGGGVGVVDHHHFSYLEELYFDLYGREIELRTGGSKRAIVDEEQ